MSTPKEKLERACEHLLEAADDVENSRISNGEDDWTRRALEDVKEAVKEIEGIIR